jgi:DNA-binding NarL/FixJ family response regulator
MPSGTRQIIGIWGTGTRRAEERHMRVLVAEDHEVVRKTLVQLLSAEADLEVVGEAYTGQMAVAQTRQLAPDVVLMDISLPVLSGIDATRAILREFPHVSVIGLSMYADSELGRALRQAGAKACVSKAFPFEAILAAIRRYAPLPEAIHAEPAAVSVVGMIERTTERAAPRRESREAEALSDRTAVEPSAGGSVPPIRVLLAEDHTLFRQGLAQLLRDESDLEVVGEAANGESALAQVAELRPEIVLMDIRMPVMNGIEATRLIRARHPQVRIIALSVTDNVADDAEMQQAGAAAFLSKVASPKDLLALIRRQGQLARGQRLAA